jgi:di/tricarboxylate transporter
LQNAPATAGFINDNSAMDIAQILVLAILGATTAMFLWGRWRHDMVAAAALFVCVAAGLVPAADAFAGFGHPAVVTVACILILSSGLKNSGAIDVLMRYAVPASSGPTLTIAALTLLAAVLSAFMNNVGALALLMPLALQIAVKQSLPPGKILMPVAFGSILGGMTTLIGTPPNLIVSGFRQQSGAGGFTMFDFAPVGLAVAAVGVLFIAIIGWRLVPTRRHAVTEGFDTGAYLTEAKVPGGSSAIGKRLFEIDEALDETDAQVIGVVRNEVRVTAPSRGWLVREGDILVIEAEADALPTALSALGLRLEEDKTTPSDKADEPDEAPVVASAPESAGEDDEIGNKDKDKNEDDDDEAKDAEDIILMELAVLPGSMIVDRSASDLLLRTRYGINLLAVSRQGRRSLARLRALRLAAGDVLLMQGSSESLAEFAANTGCVPLAGRELRIPDKRRALTAFGIMAAAIAAAASGVPAALAFGVGVLASMALRTVPPRTAYEAVDWPVIVLLAALIPVAGAMESTGAADVIARVLLENVAGGHAVLGLVLVLVVTMTLSDLMNNAATAAVMCPIAIGTANQLGVSADPFLMAVAIGASCAFLTPIGHQNNTLILGPGGFRFGDYWRMGLPLELLVIATSIPMLLVVWPL